MKLILLLTTALLGISCTTTVENIPQSADDINPLRAGLKIPNATLQTPDGIPFKLRQTAKEKPTVLVFYRGGWCPYCNQHLSALQTIEQQLLDMGFQILAISPDHPEKLRETVDRAHLSYQLLSDSSMEVSRAFGIAFELDEATVKKYKDEYKIDIEADSGYTHHQLPVPAVFLIDTTGVIRFVHTNPDYKTRFPPEGIIATAKTL